MKPFRFLINRDYSEEVYQKWKGMGFLDNVSNGYFLSYMFEFVANILLTQYSHVDKYQTYIFPLMYKLFRDKREEYSDEFIEHIMKLCMDEIDNIDIDSIITSSFSPIDAEAEATFRIYEKLKWDE